MATQTTYLGLIKPAGTDYVLVSDFNSNADTLDGAIGDLTALETTEKTSLVGAVNDVLNSASATVNVGTTTTGNPGTSASVTNSGTTKDAVFNFTIPRGEDGAPGVSVTVGTTTTGAAGTSASVTNSGTASNPILNFTIPQGANGVPTGGAIGQALIKSGLPDFVTEWAAVGRTNPNILHNWDWRTPVNQLAATGAVSNAYCIDRWIGSGTVTPSTGNYVTLANGTTMIQRMEILPAKLYSKTYTASIEIGGTIQSATLTFPSSGAGTAVSQALTGVTVEFGFVDLGGENTSLLEGTASKYIPYIKLTATAAINVQRVKLEIGNVSTLVYDSPVSPAKTLNDCYRYVQPVPKQFNRMTFCTNDFMAFNSAPLLVPMRITPTATVVRSSDIDVAAVVGAGTYSGFTYAGYANGSSNISFAAAASKTAHGLTDAFIFIKTSGAIMLYADL